MADIRLGLEVYGLLFRAVHRKEGNGLDVDDLKVDIILAGFRGTKEVLTFHFSY